MAYAYEDDEEITLKEDTEEEELDENLNVKKKWEKEDIELPKIKEDIITDTRSIDALLEADNHEYTIDNLLKEEENNSLSWDNLLTKKDDKLFKAYLGSGYKNITTKQFNYAALFLGPIYLLYRKVYTIGFVWLFLDLFAFLVLPLAKVKYYIILIFEILSFICSGLFANQIVLNHVGSRIVNYKMIENDKEKLKKKCQKNGGTNLVLALVTFILVFLIIILVFSSQLMKWYVNTKDINMKSPTMEDRVYFNGKVNIDENFNIRDNVTLVVPDDFYLANESSYQYYYVYQDPNAYMPKCMIELESVKGYKTPELFISAIASYHLELEENIQTEEINNNVWKYINVTDSSKNIYYATTLINNNMYLLKFTYQYNLEDECGSHFIEVLDSIRNT